VTQLHEKVLILDFRISVHAAHRAAGARARVFTRSCLRAIPGRDPPREPKDSSVGRPDSVYRRGRRRSTRRCSPRAFRSGDLLRMQIMTLRLGGRVGVLAGPRVRPGRRGCDRTRLRFSSAAPDDAERSGRATATGCCRSPTGSARALPRRTRPTPPSRIAPASCSECSSTGSCTRSTAPQSCGTSSWRRAAAGGDWTLAGFIEDRIRDVRSQGGRRSRPVALSEVWTTL